MDMKQTVCTIFGALGGALAGAFGGWDGTLMTLVILMAADYVTGVLVAGVFHKSDKTGTGTLSSRAGFQGLCRKGVMLLLVLVGARLDGLLGMDFLRDAVALGFAANELLSVLENGALMGVPIPAALQKALDLLDRQAGEENPD